MSARQKMREIKYSRGSQTIFLWECPSCLDIDAAIAFAACFRYADAGLSELPVRGTARQSCVVAQRTMSCADIAPACRATSRLSLIHI